MPRKDHRLVIISSKWINPDKKEMKTKVPGKTGFNGCRSVSRLVGESVSRCSLGKLKEKEKDFLATRFARRTQTGKTDWKKDEVYFAAGDFPRVK